jgi:hypothetical protein
MPRTGLGEVAALHWLRFEFGDALAMLRLRTPGIEAATTERWAV